MLAIVNKFDVTVGDCAGPIQSRSLCTTSTNEEPSFSLVIYPALIDLILVFYL